MLQCIVSSVLLRYLFHCIKSSYYSKPLSSKIRGAKLHYFVQNTCYRQKDGRKNLEVHSFLKSTKSIGLKKGNWGNSTKNSHKFSVHGDGVLPRTAQRFHKISIHLLHQSPGEMRSNLHACSHTILHYYNLSQIE